MRRPTSVAFTLALLSGASVVGALALAAIALFPANASADFDPLARPPQIVPPGMSLAGTDGADALALDPAQIAFSPSWELRATHVQIPAGQTTLTPGGGDSVGFITPIAFGLATGLRVESVRSPSSTHLPDLTTVNFALAYRLGDTLSTAIGLRRWYATDIGGLDGTVGFDFALSYRPCRYLGFSAVARDFNEPSTSASVPGVTRTFDLGVALRPTGTRAFELGLESTLYDRSELGEPLASFRGTLGVDIPNVGRALGSFTVGDPRSGERNSSWSMTAGLEVALDHLRVGGGLVGLAESPHAGWYATASVGGFIQRPTLPFDADRAVSIRIEETPGARGHVHLLQKLARLGRDPSVKAIALILKTSPASSTAHAEEIADALAALQKKGIKIICHLEDAGGKALLACAGADQISIVPAGGVRFAGLRIESMYYGETLHKIGVDPDFVRIKEHKSAAEAFVRTGPTDIARADEREELAALESIYLDRIAAGRHRTRDQIKASIARGPFIAEEAIAEGLVDRKAFDDELANVVEVAVGKHLSISEDSHDVEAPEAFSGGPHIAVIYLDGDIVDGRSQNVPLLGQKTAGSYTIAEALKAARTNPEIKGAILRIESPGGSSLASDLMWREAELLSKAKPTIVSMGGVAASGGYYAAAFGAPIYADRGTLTGSIGVFYGKADLSGLLGKLGVHVVTEKTAPRADAESLYRGFTDDERAELLHKVEQFYAVFLDRVSRGRHMTVDQVDAVGHGKVWFGAAAKEKGLVDTIGGFEDALAALERQLDLSDETPLTEYPKEKGSLLDLALSLVGVQAEAGDGAASAATVMGADLSVLQKAIAPFAQALAPFVLFRADEPLAYWEHDRVDEP